MCCQINVFSNAFTDLKPGSQNQMDIFYFGILWNSFSPSPPSWPNPHLANSPALLLILCSFFRYFAASSTSMTSDMESYVNFTSLLFIENCQQQLKHATNFPSCTPPSSTQEFKKVSSWSTSASFTSLQTPCHRDFNQRFSSSKSSSSSSPW